MDTKHVRNTSDQDLAVVGVGVVKAGEAVEVSMDFHNANFEELPVVSRSEARRRGVDVDKIENEAVADVEPKTP